MIPSLVSVPGAPWSVLPPGIHAASLDEVEKVFATNPLRRRLMSGLVEALTRLRWAGCERAYLDGSFVSSKPRPRDFDVCWDPTGVDVSKLDPVFLDFTNTRLAQKRAFLGECFPSSTICGDVGSSFLDFFQFERSTGERKGIVVIALSNERVLGGQVKQ